LPSEVYGSNSDTLKKLGDLGVCLAIDDFGAEYTSIGRLRAYGVERLKITPYFSKPLAAGQVTDFLRHKQSEATIAVPLTL